MDAHELDLSPILRRQRAAFLADPSPTLRQRLADLARLRNALVARREKFEASIAADFGHRSPRETAILDVVPVVQNIDYLGANLQRWMRPRRRRVAPHFLPARARVVYQPLGVVGIVSPWNFPLALSLTPLATALAAGNRVMLKPSEITPVTSAALAEMISESFAAEQVAVITGGPDVGAAFAALPFDHLLFTGSTNVGRAVMGAAAKNLVPVTLELGGKSPAIVAQGASLERAAACISYGKLTNAGQVCIAPDYVLVHHDEVERFASTYMDAVRRRYPRGLRDEAYASIINARHYQRLVGLLEDAKAKGARIVAAYAPAPGDADRERRLPPTVVLNTTPDMTLMQEEIFGPILPIVPYQDLSDAIAYVNSRPRPLALYVFSQDNRVVQHILAATTSGDVTINDTLLHYAVDDLPFGGVGASGMGAYHGEEGFKNFSHAKGVFEQAGWNLSSIARAPFGRLTDLMLSYLLR